MAAERVVDRRETHKRVRPVSFLLGNGETAYGYKGTLTRGVNPHMREPYADGGSFVVDRNGPELSAWGGDCRILTLYEEKSKIGAVIHFDDAEIWTTAHKTLLTDLFQPFPFLRRQGVQSYLFGDNEVELWKNDVVVTQQAHEWNTKILTTLRKNDIYNTTIFSEGLGKFVRLNTQTGGVTVHSDLAVLLFEA